MRSRQQSVRGLIVAILGSLAAPGAAHGDSLLLAGSSSAGSGASYMYTGAITPVRGDLGNGVVAGVFLHRLTYLVDTADGVADTTRFGVSGSLGLRRSFGGDWLGIHGGVVNEKQFQPDRPQPADEGGAWLGRVEAEAGGAAGVWRADARLSLTPALHGYWSRAALQRDLRGYFAGPELLFHGNKNYRVTQAGIAVGGITGPGDTQFGFSLGHQASDTRQGWYAGVGIAGHLR